MEVVQKARDVLFPGFDLKHEQVYAIESILCGNHTIACLPVGFGKSLIYQMLPESLHLMGKPDKVIVVCPLNSIINDQLERLKALNIPTVGMDITCSVMNDDKCAVDAASHSSIILCHPEALFCDDGKRMMLSLQQKVSALVIDECHKIEEWGREFRKSFGDLAELKSFFPNVPFLCLSGTMLQKSVTYLCKSLDLMHPVIISVSPDISNVYFDIKEKKQGDVGSVMEDIFVEEIDKLNQECHNYPVTLMFMPLQYMAQAMRYCKRALKSKTIESSLYAALFSSQDQTVVKHILQQLKMDDPDLRLIFCTSVIGMGFDSPSVSKIIHVRPPRSLSNYMQEVGRAGRRGQKAHAILYFYKADIASNVAGMQEDIVDIITSDTCIRECILKYFGFSKSEVAPNGCKCCSICYKSCKCKNCQQHTIM